MRIVIATDGSPAAARAAVGAHALAGPGHELHLVTVVPPREDPMVDATGFAGPVLTPEEVDRDYRAGVVAGHAALATTARALGNVPLDQQVVEGDDPVEAICQSASALAADLVVVGSNGAGGSLFGSVSAHLVHHADRPVLIVPTSPDQRAGRSSELPSAPDPSAGAAPDGSRS